MPIFVSHSHKDGTVVAKIHQDLAAAGLELQVAPSGISPGTKDWRQWITDAIKSCTHFIYVHSDHARKSREVRLELNLALKLSKQIIVICLDESERPYEIGLFQEIELPTSQSSQEDEIRKVIAAIKRTGRSVVTLRTNISRAYWCSWTARKAKFEPIRVSLASEQGETDVAWFDRLFDGGIRLPDERGQPLTLLITGPPGSGKTKLAMEMCYRLAKNENQSNEKGLCSLYLSPDSEAVRIIDGFRELGYEDTDQYLKPFDEHFANSDGVTVWGRDQIEGEIKLDRIVEGALAEIPKWLQKYAATELERLIKERIIQKLERPLEDGTRAEPGELVLRPHILAIDSLNIVEPKKGEEFFQEFLAKALPATKLVLIVLNSSAAGEHHKIWEYASDIVIRMNYTTERNYYLREMEIVKARYQYHTLGRHQVKIYPHLKSKLPAEDDPHRNDKMGRFHPYRTQGGIFIYPSIHYYLSLYKRDEPMPTPRPVSTRPSELNEILKVPEARCTAFIGGRGGHKSHLGYLHLLHRIMPGEESNERDTEEAALVVSLRDDENMSRKTMAGIISAELGDRLPKDSQRQDVLRVLDDLRAKDQLEILYYHPGYITPEEFFHRMYVSIQRLKRKKRKLTVLFNSLDQLAGRFPLCAKQEILVPGIIDILSGEGATSIFIAVDEPGQPVEQYALLPMADLILSFYPYRLPIKDYCGHIIAARKIDAADDGRKERLKRMLKQRQFVEATILQVVRFAGGQRAGERGLLELAKEGDLGPYERPGLHFTQLSPKFPHGIRTNQ